MANPLDWFSSPGSLGPNSIYDAGAMSAQQMMPQVGTGQVNPTNMNFGSPGLGWNLGTAQLGVQGLGAILNFWNGMQAQGLAKKQFDFTKRTTETNLANQLQSYNTALTDRARSRGFTEGQSAEQQQDYINRNRLIAR